MNVFKQIVDFVHGPKNLSLNHWRYRVLHYVHNKTQGQRSYDLPAFLYTNYCPLFHYTNFLVLLIPLVYVIRMFGSLISDVKENYNNREDVRHRKHVNAFCDRIKNYLDGWQSYKWSFEHFKEIYNGSITEFTKAYNWDLTFVEKLYNVMVEARYAKERQKRITQERIVMFSNVSRWVGKIAVVLLALFGVVVLSFVGYVAGPPVLEVLVYLYGIIPWIGIFKVLVVLMLAILWTWILNATGFIDLLMTWCYRIRPKSNTEKDIYEEAMRRSKTDEWVHNIFNYIWWAIKLPFRAIGWTVYMTCVFIYTMYHNMCPPIILQESKNAGN